MKLKPILLEDTTGRNYPCILMHSHMFGGPGKLGYYECNIRTPTLNYQIYLVDPTAEIKEGDYYISNNQICICEKVTNIIYNKIVCASIARVGHDYKNDVPNGDDYNYIVPKLSEEAIESLIKYYNSNGEMPDEVDVGDTDYESWYQNGASPVGCKLNQQSEVDITIPKVEGNLIDKLYNVIEAELELFNAINPLSKMSMMDILNQLDSKKK